VTISSCPDDSDDAQLRKEPRASGTVNEAVLVMPFVTVFSRGGPHDDASYVAGWEMGGLNAELEHARVISLERLIHTENAAQADLIAMRYGYRAEIEPTHVDGWSSLRLTRSGVG
jgi:hypothetical protein